MKRRTILAALGSTFAAWPLDVRPQGAMRGVGFLHSASAGQVADLLAAFHTGLKEAGFVEGQNVAMDYRWAENDEQRLPKLAADLVARKVAVIATAGGDRTAIAAKRETSTVPIVSVIGGDPIAEGLVASLAHPGGNLTGVAFLTASLTTKRLGLLLELVPQAKVVALLVHSSNPQSPAVIDDMLNAAQAKGLHLLRLEANSEAEIDQAFATMGSQHAGALVIQADPYFTLSTVRSRLISLAARYGIPAIHERRAFVSEGGLISYGTSLPDVYRQVGLAVGKVLKGAKPAELPVVQPTKFELAINAKAAKALGLAVPSILAARADEVIE
jgi:putative tryptophan/tyrosine transport system substrate-binding protein